MLADHCWSPPGLGRGPAGGQRMQPPPGRATAPTGWILALSIFFVIISQSRHSYTGLINHHCHWGWQQTRATDLQKLLDFLCKSTMQRPMPTWHGANHPFSVSPRADDTAGTQNQQRAGKWNLHPHPTADLEMQIKMGIPCLGVCASSLLLLAFISERGRKVHHLVALAQPKQHTTAG